MSEVSYARNTPVWALDRLRSDALPRLLDDLQGRHLDGIPEEVCIQVKATHQGLLDFASTIPDHALLRGSILGALQKYSDSYVAWNDIKGNDEHHRKERDATVRKMRDARHAFAATLRQNNHVLAENIDLKQVDAMYSSLEGLTKAAPGIFARLAQATARYFLRRDL